MPVSNSGHLILGQYFLGLDQDAFGLPFDASVHLRMLSAVVTYFRRDLARVALAFVGSLPRPDPDERLTYVTLTATVPAALVGFLLEDFWGRQRARPGRWSPTSRPLAPSSWRARRSETVPATPPS